ncbi:MAG: phospholipid carrier-dependent glycosyltransferase [Pirellulaceae bacterium]
MNEREIKRWSRNQWIAALLMVGSVRLAILWFSPDRLDLDPDNYRRLGRIWSETGTFGELLPPSSQRSATDAADSEDGTSPTTSPSASPGNLPAEQQVASSADRATEVLAREVRGEIQGVRPTAYRPPLYPAVLAGLDRFGWLNRTGIATVNWLAGVGSVLLLAWLANRLHGGRTAWLATALLTFDPLSALYSTQAMTETVATFWVMAATVLVLKAHQRSQWGWAIAAGITLGLGSLTRPPILVWAAGLLAWEVGYWLAARHGWRRRPVPSEPRSSEAENRDLTWNGEEISPVEACRTDRLAVRLVGISLGLVLVIAPWGLRNLWLLGEFRVTTTHGGYTLFLANNSSFYHSLRTAADPRDWEASAPDFQAQLRAAYPDRVEQGSDELVRDRAWSQAAWASIRSDWPGFARGIGTRLSWFWALSPNLEDNGRGRAVTLAVAFYYGAVFSLVCFSLWTVRRWGYAWRALGILVLVLTALHSLYWSNPRMRTPISPWLCWTAAACLSLTGRRD